MKIGTKSVLFGVHCWLIHPVLVLRAWFIVHRRRPSLVELMAIFTHDLGYWGMPNMDGKEGSNHPERAASWWRGKFGEFGDKVAVVIIGHSRFHAAANNIELSSLFQPDKLATSLYPIWLYLLLANLSGEIDEYMHHYNKGLYTGVIASKKQSQTQWLLEVQAHMALMGLLGKEYYIVKKQMEANEASNDKKILTTEYTEQEIEEKAQEILL